MSTLKQFWVVFKTIFKNNFKKTKGLGEKKSHKVISLILIGFGALTILAYYVLYVLFLTRSSIQAGINEQVLYLFIAMGQFVVLFFGAFVAMNYLYFSRDNALLMSLPISEKTIFLAKLAMVYFANFVISLLFIVPSLTTYGVVSIAMGVPLNATFFILIALGVIVFPAVPLLLVSLISLPLMYLVAFLRKRALSNAIAITIVIVLVMTLYFAIIGGFANLSEEMEDGVIILPAQIVNLVNLIKRITIFNKPFVEAMLGKKTALNLLIYLGEILVLAAVNLLLSAVLYRKGISVIVEGEGKTSALKKNKELVYTSAGLKTSFLKKEIKTLFNTPTLLVNSFMGVILCPIMIYFLVGTGAISSISESPQRAEIYAIGFVSYLVSLMVGATNQIAMVGISREGKNLFALKALPLSAEMLVRTKLYFASTVNIVTILVVTILYALVSPTHNILAALGVAAVAFTSGFGINCLGLYNDLKTPNLKWNNITELTRNNKKALKPTLIAVGVGLSYLIIGMILSIQQAISVMWSYVIFFGIAFLANSLFMVVGYKKLFDNPAKLLEEIES